MNMKITMNALVLLWAILPFPALAQDGTVPSTKLINDHLIDEVRTFLQNPVVSISLIAQNKKYDHLSEAEINELDQQWRMETKSEDQPLIATTLTNPLSSYLTQIQAASGGVINEMFVMDALGLNIGQSSVTSDYWQGDEAKYQKTFSIGPKAVFLDEPEFDQGNKIWKVQVSFTLADPDEKPVGAVTIEYNLTELARRNATN